MQFHRDVYELCCVTKPLRIGSFHDQFRYTPETKNLGSVLLRSDTFGSDPYTVDFAQIYEYSYIYYNNMYNMYM